MRRIGGSAVAFVLLASLVFPGSGVAVAEKPGPTPTAGPTLSLGPEGLRETRSEKVLQPGVTFTTIDRGSADPYDYWTVEIRIPAGIASPDPDAPATALSTRAGAEELAAKLREARFTPRVEQVTAPDTADYKPGRLGWRVRVGHLNSQAEADLLKGHLADAGFAGASRFTGWDGGSRSRGPWRIRVLTIDPQRFSGRLLASYGPNLEDRETVSALSRAVGATAATNAGYFVFDPAAGAPGDPAGVGVYRGRLLSETVNARPALVLNENAEGSQVDRLRWVGTVKTNRHTLRLDGVNRVPGLIRNCGGRGDSPTNRPIHDFTCTDPGELIAFTPQFGASTPAGRGLEAVLDKKSRVVSVRRPRGGPLLAGYTTVQATGNQIGRFRREATVGARLKVRTRVLDTNGRRVTSTSKTSIVNGGPELVRRGRIHVTPRRDGFVRPDDPSTYYGFSAQRNPRTFAGIDKRGRTIIVTADGRSLSSNGLSITETGAVARDLGMVSALNLDGGGSTTMVVGGKVTNQPSDATGERPIGDALLVLPL